MADLANAAILASLVVGMVSIPAASGNIEGQNSIPEPVDNISSSQSLPKETSTELGSASFTRKISTAFSTFRTSVESGSVEGVLKTPQSELNLEKDSGTVTWRLETPQGRLKVEKTPTGVVETTETPQGTLIEKTKNGAYSSTFEGSDREAVEQISEELRELMEKKKEKYRQKSSKMKTGRYGQGLSLNVTPESPENVVLRNALDRSIDLRGWRIANNNPESYEFNASLGPGQALHLYSADVDDQAVENVTEEEGDVYIYGSGLTWENGGDTATLFDSKGNEVEKYSY